MTDEQQLNEQEIARAAEKHKLQKALGKVAVGEIDGLDEFDLERRILKTQDNLRLIARAREDDQDLRKAKGQVSYCEQPYKAATTREQNVAKYASLLREERRDAHRNRELYQEIRDMFHRAETNLKAAAPAPDDAEG